MGSLELIDYKTSTAWQEARRLGIGASEAGTLFGLTPPGRDSPYAMWCRKSGLWVPQNEPNELFEFGHRVEPIVAQAYADRTGSKVWTPPSPYCVAVSPKLPFMFATLDRWILFAKDRPDRGDLEIKNVSVFAQDWKKDGAFTVPLYVQAQVQHQLAVTGFRWGVVAALVGGNKLEIIPIERNDEFIEALEEKLVEFWRRVQTGDPPPIDGYEATSNVIRELHPSDNGETIELRSDAADLWAELEAAKEEEKAAETRAEQAENRLREILGENTYGSLPDGRRLSLKTSDRAGYTKVVQPSKYRQLRIEKPKQRR